MPHLCPFTVYITLNGSHANLPQLPELDKGAAKVHPSRVGLFSPTVQLESAGLTSLHLRTFITTYRTDILLLYVSLPLTNQPNLLRMGIKSNTEPIAGTNASGPTALGAPLYQDLNV